jgi:hypothetical protein
VAFTVTAVNDGNDVWGMKRVLQVQLKPAISDYASGGYLIQGIAGTTESTGNVGLAKVFWAIPIGGEGGYKPTFNPVTSKVQIFQQSAITGPLTEVLANTDLSGQTFNLLVVGDS